MKLFEIDSSETISRFLSFLYNKAQFSFDPAQDISLLMDERHQLLFPATEGAYYEKVMNEALIFCVFNKLNIYKIAKQVAIQSESRIAA